MAIKISETETVVKRILPYLVRRGYVVESDLHFEILAKSAENYKAGFVDILVWIDKDKRGARTRPDFLIEAKRVARALADKDRKQALAYAKSEKLDVPFVVVANGADVRCFNTKSGDPIRWNGKLAAKIPAKSQLSAVIAFLRRNPDATDVELKGEASGPSGVSSLPFRPGLPLRQLNSLFGRCHDGIRKNEKDEGHIFDDFSKLLFLKLLEEKADTDNGFGVPYTYLFHELAAYPVERADQVENAVRDMIQKIKERTAYGDVLAGPIHLKNAKTFHYIVKQLAGVSFTDSGVDSKGAAFEYFVRATLKGKKLGQYFTPRPVVQIMAELVGKEKILNALLAGGDLPPKVLDPACGTGGFLVYLLNDCLALVEGKKNRRSIDDATAQRLAERLKKEVFFGSDANEGVACAAKMNMIVAGDGHSNIRAENSLSVTAKNWSIRSPDCDFILTNPPFGTSENGALEAKDYAQFDIRTPKGQWLFLQKMVSSTRRGGEICTVIDEGVLNTESAKDIRRWLLNKCKILAVVSLPDETFKPNKINVRSSLIYMQRRTQEEEQLEEIDYAVVFVHLHSIGCDGTGDHIRNFDFDGLLADVRGKWLAQSGKVRNGDYWRAFDVHMSKLRDIELNSSFRIDVKFWDIETRCEIDELKALGAKPIRDLNKILTSRGSSPSADAYVDRPDGYALVIKAGSSITKDGELLVDGDYIEKSLFDEVEAKAKSTGRTLGLVQEGDVLLASTGDGTLGKCCVFRRGTDVSFPAAALADGHVTIIRVDPDEIWPEYLCDYLRMGFGAEQIRRLFTGSTGMIELSPSGVDCIVVPLLSGPREQQQVSNRLRAEELRARQVAGDARSIAEAGTGVFKGVTSAASLHEASGPDASGSANISVVE